MKLRTKYLLFVVILHLAALVLSFLVIRENKIYFLVAELVILISAVISWQLYNELIQPLKMLMEGINAIRDRDFNVKFVKTGKYEMDQLIGVYNQMMDQLREERTQQKEQHFFLEKLINTSPTGIIILDYDENIAQVNPRGLQILELEEKDLVGRAIQEVDHPIITEISQLKTGQAKSVNINGIETYKCQKSSFIHQGFPRYFIMLEELTNEILLAEKKAYGKVIRMMAHEVNNTIGPVNSILNSTLTYRTAFGESMNENLREALQVAVERNNNLNIFMRNLADVVRLPLPNKQAVDIHELITKLNRLLEMRALDKGIRIEYDLAEGALIVFADIQQMEQVLINIVKNSIDAIEAGSGGCILFTTKAFPPQLIIADNGKGISPEAEKHLFTPFFSTKKDGQGVGLTLIREVLVNHGFDFSLATEQGWTKFRIFFS